MTHSEQLLKEYLVSRELVFQYEPRVPGKGKRPDFRVEHGEKTVWLEVKELEAPAQRPTNHFDPLLAIAEKIDQARKKFKEFKDCCCGLVIHSCKSVVHRPIPIEFVLAAMFGENSYCAPLSFDRIEDEPYRFRFFGPSKLRHDSNTTISAIVLLQHWEVYEQWVDVKNALLNRQMKGEKITPGADFQLLAEWQNEPLRVTHPNTLRCVALTNPYARIPFPHDLFNGLFDQLWGRGGDDYTLLSIGSELEKLRQRPKPVPYVYL